MKFYKKGSEMWPADTFIWWILYGIVLGGLAVWFISIVANSGTDQAKIKRNLETLFLMQRFTSNCFAKDNALNLIDAGRFNEEDLANCYTISGNMPAFMLTLNSESAKIYRTIKTKNWNENRQTERRISKNILVYSEAKTYNGKIAIEMQNLQK